MDTFKTKVSLKDRKDMNYVIQLSFLVGFLMLGLKTYAYSITSSVAILTDAAESIIHVFAVGFAAYSMWYSFRPADANHLYGHDKISFFSAGFEGALIVIASLYVVAEAIYKMIFGFEINNLDVGIGFVLISALINLGLSIFLRRKGKKYKSIVLEANSKHILSDCITSFGIIVALILVKITGITMLDPIVAILASISIFLTGIKLIRRSFSGLMDKTDPKLHAKIVHILKELTEKRNLAFHALRHRYCGHKVFIDFELLFPGPIDLAKAHDIASEVESSLSNQLDIDSMIVTHLEPMKKI